MKINKYLKTISRLFFYSLAFRKVLSGVFCGYSEEGIKVFVPEICHNKNISIKPECVYFSNQEAENSLLGKGAIVYFHEQGCEDVKSAEIESTVDFFGSIDMIDSKHLIFNTTQKERLQGRYCFKTKREAKENLELFKLQEEATRRTGTKSLQGFLISNDSFEVYNAAEAFQEVRQKQISFRSDFFRVSIYGNYDLLKVLN